MTSPTGLDHDDSVQGVTRRRGNCHDNAVADSFFQLLERERIKRRIYREGNASRSLYLKSSKSVRSPRSVLPLPAPAFTVSPGPGIGGDAVSDAAENNGARHRNGNRAAVRQHAETE